MQMLPVGETRVAERWNLGPVLGVRRPLVMCAQRESDTSTLGLQGKEVELPHSHTDMQENLGYCTETSLIEEQVAPHAPKTRSL